VRPTRLWRLEGPPATMPCMFGWWRRAAERRERNELDRQEALAQRREDVAFRQAEADRVERMMAHGARLDDLMEELREIDEASKARLAEFNARADEMRKLLAEA